VLVCYDNPAVEKTGGEPAKGIEISLRVAPVSELMFLMPHSGKSAKQERKIS